jgi:hypothetical protein
MEAMRRTVSADLAPVCRLSDDACAVRLHHADRKAHDFKARGRTLRFDGWTKVMPALRKGDEDRTLPVVKGDSLSLVELTLRSTLPRLARFSEASLVKSWKNAVSAVRPPMRRSFRPFRIAATCGWKTVASPKNG